MTVLSLDKFIRNMVFVFCFVLCPLLFFGHPHPLNDSIPKSKVENLKFNTKQLIIPASLCTYGIVALGNDFLKDINEELREEINENIDEKFTIDDFSQFMPALSVYGLNSLGIHGRNNLKDRSIILATSLLISSGLSGGLKSITKIERPDGTSNNSFPSGHTVTAFSGAEFLWQEYKDENIWYGISGYLVATVTGLFRIYNGRHWLSDVVMGAGVGIISTKVAYWVFPVINTKIFKSQKNMTSVIIPTYNGKELGIGVIISLK